MSALTDNLPVLLVVEDEKNTRDGLRRYFDGKYDIYLAPDNESALSLLESQPVDLLLTDLRLTGGTEGLDATVLARADATLSLGRLTWPHYLARAMLAEQLFRAHSILTGHPYHREGRP